MQVSGAGVEFIKSWEGFEARAYRDVAGVWTIGYGHTEGFREGRFDAASVITEAAAKTLLREDLRPCEEAVSDAVGVKLAGHEFDALASLAYNIGVGGFRGSTVLRRLNAGDRDGAGDAFLMWDKARIDGRLQISPGLARRRKAERALFLNCQYPSA